MSGLRLLPPLLRRARRSRFWLGVLNRLLWRVVPFNRPHRIRIERLGETEVRTLAPYRRSSFNHLKGVHACAIATVAEFSSGLLLLSRLDPRRYRLIMAHLEVDYLHQARSDIVAVTELSADELEPRIVKPLESRETLFLTLPTAVSDRDGREVARARITWQIKAWSRVGTHRTGDASRTKGSET